jgi:hypothetical protein
MKNQQTNESITEECGSKMAKDPFKNAGNNKEDTNKLGCNDLAI